MSLRRHLIGIFVASLAVRMLFIWVQATFHVFDIYFVASDTRLYEGLATSLASGGAYSWEGRPTALVTPGYPIFLAVLHLAGIQSPLWIGFIQAVLGAVSCLLIAAIAWRLYGVRAAIFAGWLSAFYVHLIFWTGYVLTETLFVFFIVASLLALLRWQANEGSYSHASTAGVVLGLGALTRPHLALFALLAVAYVIVTARRRREAAVSGALVLVVFTGMIAPWILRNYRVFGTLIAGSTLSGEVLYQGNSEGATGGSGGYLDARDFRRLDLPPDLPELDVNRAYARAARQFMAHHPGRLPGLALTKFVNMWRPTYTGASMRNVLIFAGTYLMVVALSGVGLVRLHKSGADAGSGLLLLCLAFFVTSHLVLPGMIRYRLPAEPVLIVFAASGLQSMLRRDQHV